ncbi:MAG: hypothetical protein JXR12_01105 [Neptunomonas phycophila]|uniref:hypothetical protein n=1 Tax=Neptunomonas phycophila TaxID=1572645 RepID=UPI003B8DD027
MNPNDIIFDIESGGLMNTGASITISDSKRDEVLEMINEMASLVDARNSIIADLASVQPIANMGWFDVIPHAHIAEMMGLSSDMLGEEKSSGPISEISITSIL